MVDPRDPWALNDTSGYKENRYASKMIVERTGFFLRKMQPHTEPCNNRRQLGEHAIGVDKVKVRADSRDGYAVILQFQLKRSAADA